MCEGISHKSDGGDDLSLKSVGQSHVNCNDATVMSVRCRKDGQEKVATDGNFLLGEKCYEDKSKVFEWVNFVILLLSSPFWLCQGKMKNCKQKWHVHPSEQLD
jgi:hypothetical protein